MTPSFEGYSLIGIYESTTFVRSYTRNFSLNSGCEKKSHISLKKVEIMKFLNSIHLILIVLIGFSFPSVVGETIKHTMEGSMELEISYPESIVVGRTFSISILIENKGWEEKQDISLKISNPDGSIIPANINEIVIERLSTEGSYGATVDFNISPEATVGTHFLNILYSQVLVKNNEEPQNPTTNNIAIPIFVKEQPRVTIHTITPEIIFPNAEFPFEVEIISEDIELTNVILEIKPPKNITFLGEGVHSFSSIQKNVPISVISQIKTPQQELATEHKILFEVIVTYTDDVDNEKINSKTIQMTLRPRTFMEITTDGGIWVGDFFIAPYVSIGTIVGIPAGTLFSLAIKRKLEKRRKGE